MNTESVAQRQSLYVIRMCNKVDECDEALR